MGSSQRRRVLVYRWAVAGVLPLISLSSFQRILPTALPSPSPLQKVPNNGAPRVDLAQKCRQCLLWGSKNSGLIQATSCAYIHSHHVFPFTILPTQPSALFQRSATRLILWVPGIRGDAVGRSGLKKFPARLRLAGSGLHPTPKSQEATGSSQSCELQVPQFLSRALPRLPRP